MAKGSLPFVIGTGLGRTGTLSLYTALNQLGYKSFHMAEILLKGVTTQSWFDLAEAKMAMLDGEHDLVNSSGERSEAEELVDRLVQEIVGIGYDATTDFPACLLYKEFMELVPDAKVILSVRTSGDVWSKSTQSTIGQMGGIVNHAPFRFTSHFRGFAVLDNWSV